MEKKVFWRRGWSERRKEEMKEMKERKERKKKKGLHKKRKKDNSGKGVYLGSVISSMLAYKSS